MTYTLSTTITLPWADAVDRARDALSAEGFGILTEINVRSTFEAKLGAEAADAVGDYVILGACNPGLASRALAAEPEIGALLPCNVVVAKAKTQERPSSRPSTRKPWSSSALRRLLKRSQTTPAPVCAGPLQQ